MRRNHTKYGHFFRVGLFFILIGMVALPSTVVAHRVTLFAWVDGNTIHTQSRFAGGRMVKNGTITVFDAKGERLLTGKTDDQGAFSFHLANTSGARIVLDAGMGHGTEWIISEVDIVDNETQHEHALGQSKNDLALEQKATTAAVGHVKPNQAKVALSYEQVKAIVDESMDNKLKPIMITLSQLQDESPSIADILGGIGYIIGLVGLGAYMKSRRKNRKNNRS